MPASTVDTDAFRANQYHPDQTNYVSPEQLALGQRSGTPYKDSLQDFCNDILTQEPESSTPTDVKALGLDVDHGIAALIKGPNRTNYSSPSSTGDSSPKFAVNCVPLDVSRCESVRAKGVCPARPDYCPIAADPPTVARWQHQQQQAPKKDNPIVTIRHNDNTPSAAAPRPAPTRPPTSTLKRSYTETTDPASGPLPGKPPTKTDTVEGKRTAGRVPHNLIERRYREHLNGQIEQLRLSLPAPQGSNSAGPDCVCTSGDLEDATALPARLPPKAAVISGAIGYIKELEEEREASRARMQALEEQVAGLQKLVRCEDCSVIQYLNSLQVEGTHAGAMGV